MTGAHLLRELPDQVVHELGLPVLPDADQAVWEVIVSCPRRMKLLAAIAFLADPWEDDAAARRA
ncbi:hypothetical protein ACIBOV_19300 [Micromonospora chersina]|uniref:hypothetical protein n=1 Tax=Micromonospora chersina TaxID=47854 RepID=UPI0037AFCA9B